MKKRIVISLGGSQIIPDGVNYSYLKEFKKVITKNMKNYEFVIVCGGGSLARKYIGAIEKNRGSVYYQSLAGISATRSNARFLSYFFGFDPHWGIPHNMRVLKKYLRKRGIVICGGLEYKPDQTSDSTSAQVASKLGAEFVNITDVNGLYTKNPKEFKDAKFISKISWTDFHKRANEMKFKPGQHFVLDQNASKIIMDKKIKTYIMKGSRELDNLLNNRKFKGTVIEG